MTDILIRELTKADLSNGFLETLSSLKKLSMTSSDAESIFENISAPGRPPSSLNILI